MVINALLSFLLEVSVLFVYAYAPFAIDVGLPPLAKIALSALLAVLVVVAWARFAAPKSSQRLAGLRLAAFKFGVFLPALVVVGVKFGILYAFAGLVFVLVNLIVEYRINQ